MSTNEAGVEPDVTRQGKFISLLCLGSIGVLCSLVQLYHLLFTESLRRSLSNHVLIGLLLGSLLTSVIDLPLILIYLYEGRSPVVTSLGCHVWNFIDLSLYALVSLLMLWASMERHLLVFHDHKLHSSSRRFFFHYLPLLVVPIYVMLFYGLVIFVHPCVNAFDYTQVVCGIMCYYEASPWLGFLDQALHNIIPTVLIVLLNVVLFIRVLWQKRHRMRQPIRWRQHRRMVLQLVPASVLYVCGVIPYGLLFSVHLLGGWSDVGIDLQGHFFYLFYYIAVLLPFVCLLGMPSIYSKLCRKRQVQIFPTLK